MLVQMADDDVPDEVYEDDDDENEENNWRNDYPDEDECSDQEARYMGNFHVVYYFQFII